MARDPKRSLQTLGEYAYRQDDEENPIKSFRSAGIAGIIGLLGFAAVVFFFLYLGRTSTESIQALSDLENEYQKIAPPPSTIQRHYSASRKMRQALVTAEYTTSISYQQIHDSYQNELIKNGWRFVAERPSTPPEGNDPGFRTVFYRKGKYQASLEYEGADTNAGYTYAFSLSWGLSPP